MNKQLSNMISGLIALYIIYHLIITGVNTAWNWFLRLLTNIGIWIQNYIELILISIIFITIILILKSILKKQQTPNLTFTDHLDNDSLPLTEEDKQKISFEHWYQIQQNPTLKQTQQITEIINEMLKSNRHQKEHRNRYKELLNLNGSGYVYFVKAPDGTTKIGLTQGDPFKRIARIFGGVNTSYDVEVIHLIRTNQPQKLEKKFHEYFKEKRYINPYDPTEKSEFFHLDQEDWKWIKRQSSSYTLDKAK